jgi:predicted RND superfamily exporter protein
LSLAAPILVFNNLDVGDTISYSFKFVSGHWWETFGVMLVVGIITTIIGYIFAIPGLIYFFIKMGTVILANAPAAVADAFKDPIYLVLNGISYIGQFILYAVTLIANVFIYFDIAAQKYGPGTHE